MPYIRMETALYGCKIDATFRICEDQSGALEGGLRCRFLLMAAERLPAAWVASNVYSQLRGPNISIHGHSAYISMRRQFCQSFALCEKIETMPGECGA